MPPVLRLFEDVLANGAEVSLPACPRMIFVVHGSIAMADRSLHDAKVGQRKRYELRRGPRRRNCLALGNDGG